MDNTERILREFRSIAVVGLSRDPSKAAHAIPARLQSAGFRVIPVNPLADTLLGEKSYAELSDVPFSVEVVLVFRPSEEAAAVAKAAVAIGGDMTVGDHGGGQVGQRVDQEFQDVLVHQD